MDIENLNSVADDDAPLLFCYEACKGQQIEVDLLINRRYHVLTRAGLANRLTSTRSVRSAVYPSSVCMISSNA